MLDKRLRRHLDPILDSVARQLADAGIGANTVTIAGLAIGLLAALAISQGFFLTGLVIGALSRLCDGLDGAVARRTGTTDLGGLLDIVLDFVFYGAIPLAFVIVDPAANAVAGAVLLLTFYANGGSLLAFALMLEKEGKADQRLRGGKALIFTEGLMEGTETLVFFALFCLFPSVFPALAFLFAGLTAFTFVARLYRASKTLD